jgi:hypothetical protein
MARRNGKGGRPRRSFESYLHSLQILVSELLQILIRSSAVVILEVGGIAPLERGEALDAEFRAQRLALGGAVDVGDQFVGGTLEIGDELVPVGFDRLAVAAPTSWIGFVIATSNKCQNIPILYLRDQSVGSTERMDHR